MTDNVFHLRVISREGILFEDDVSSISSYNEKGLFDVLAQHANFISLLQKSMQIIDLQGQKKEITFPNALMKVSQNHVNIYLGIEWLISANKVNNTD
jgi:F0F1-type ATP synthase epsilon subunit